MNKKDYMYFREVAKCLNYTKAAENLYISQPALTKRIGDIERKLGITLFYRTKHSVSLTPAGRILLEEYPKVTTCFENLMAKAKLANEGKIGTLRIGLQEGQNLDEDLVYELKKFKDKYPDIEVIIACYPYNQLLKMLETGEIDFGFSLYFDAADYNVLEVKVIKEMESYIVVSADNEMCTSDELNFEKLNEHTLLIVGSGVVSSGAWFVKNQCRENQINPAKIKLIDRYSTLHLLLVLNEGFAFMNQNTWFTDSKLRFFPMPQGNAVTRVASWRGNNDNPVLSILLEEIHLFGN
ncbi:LysR family transcriptional regulator [Emergencia sp.]|uniref:LysR family transcriptional regulator n=1 Tax=Emergencia sp. TaxID=1926557 RepID=UPI003AF076CA